MIYTQLARMLMWEDVFLVGREGPGLGTSLCTWPMVTLSKIILLSGPYFPHLGKGHVMLDMCLLDTAMVKHSAPRFKRTSHKCSSK